MLSIVAFLWAWTSAVVIPERPVAFTTSARPVVDATSSADEVVEFRQEVTL